MSDPQKWRVAHLGGLVAAHDEFVSKFKHVYEANNKPDYMAMFSHVDSLGAIMALSITPNSVPYCPFSADWSEADDPRDFGNVGWVAGDVRFKQ